MSWYSKPASRWWEESSEKKWHDRESSRSLAKAWNSEGHETWNGQSRGKDDWKALGEWAQSKTKTKGDFRASPGDWSGKVKAWKSEKIEKLQRHQWVAKSDKQLESDKPPSMDPAVALEGALADVEELLGERLDSTRELLEDSHRSAMEAVRLATLALELLTRKAVDCKNEEDLNNVMRAKQSVRELLMWRNFGLKTWLHNKPDPMNFQRYDAEVQNELRQTFTKIEQNLLQELVAGSDRVIIKKTFIEVEDEKTPTGLPATYNSDSVIWSRLMRQISPGPEEQQPIPFGVMPENEDLPEPENPHLSKLNKKERLSRSSVSTDDTDTETEPHEAMGPIRDGREGREGHVSLMRLREPSPDTLDAARTLAVTEASKALEAAGITMERLPLDELLMQFSPEPRPVSLLEAVGDVGPGISTHSAKHRKPGDTTVMLRNLPNNYSRNMVCTMMDKEGFQGKYDFLYLPIDFRSEASLGYAFVNLINEGEAQKFWKTFDGYTKWVLPSAKVCSISWSGPHQGQESHVQRYRDSPIMHSSVPDEFKPVIFEAGTGKRLDFPQPSKKLRAPRRRPATLK